jgi:hypothetical protein
MLSKKNTITNAHLLQTFEPGIQFPLETLPGKVFLCTKEKDESQTINKLHYLGITQSQIIELHDYYPSLSSPNASSLNSTIASQGNSSHDNSTKEWHHPPESVSSMMMVEVVECHELSALVKVKYKRDEIITFQFHSGTVIRYYMFDSTACVAYIKQLMSKSGIPSTTHLTMPKLSTFFLKSSSSPSTVSSSRSNHHTPHSPSSSSSSPSPHSHSYSSSATASAFSQQKTPITSHNLLFYIKEIEYQFTLKPSHDLVIQMVDLLRDAVECFGETEEDEDSHDDEKKRKSKESGGDGSGGQRSQSIVSYVQQFLQRDDVIEILDQQNPQKRVGSLSSASVTEVEVITVPPVGEIPQPGQPMTSRELFEFDSSVAETTGVEEDDHKVSLSDDSPSPSLAPTLEEEEETQSAVLTTHLDCSDDELSSALLFLTPLGGGDEFNDYDSEADDTSSEDLNSSYLQLQPLVCPREFSTTTTTVPVNVPWDDESMHHIQQTLHDMDHDEAELGFILTELDHELEEILGSPTGGVIISVEDSGTRQGSLNDFLVTFEEFDSFLEELNDGI